jgi:3-dehydroquinate synthase
MIIDSDYKIFIEEDIIRNFNFTDYTKTYIITHENLYSILNNEINNFAKAINCNSIFTIPDGEQHKSLANVEKAINDILKKNLDRKSLIINFGGGLISDFGGFVASVYMRGIDFINISTTLLSAIDASIGGKNAVNCNNIKNIIGTFTNPKAIFIHSKFFQTLNKRQILNGLAEAAKHAIIDDNEEYLTEIVNFVNDYLDANPNLATIKDIVPESKQVEYNKRLLSIIQKSCIIKNEIVNNDFKESGVRKILNFGHTVGHAIESYCIDKSIDLLHGEAIALGMLIETIIAKNIILDSNLKFIEISSNNISKEKDYVFEYMDSLKEFVRKLAINKNIFQMLSNIDCNTLSEILLLDKKNESKDITIAISLFKNKLHLLNVDSKTIHINLKQTIHSI